MTYRIIQGGDEVARCNSEGEAMHYAILYAKGSTEPVYVQHREGKKWREVANLRGSA